MATKIIRQNNTIRIESKAGTGPPGQTPYIQDGNWWIGDTDTGVQAEATDGQDGDTPEIVDGNWHIGGVDTGVQAEGVDGEDADMLVVPRERSGPWTLEIDEFDADVYTGASDAAATIPPESTTAFPDGYVRTIAQKDAGVVTLTAGQGVTILGNLKTGGQNKVIQAWRLAADEWLAIGGVE